MLKNSLFIKFRDEFLSSDSRVFVMREKMTKKDNEALSKNLKKFLILLSAYFMNENTLKVLEFLIRNYEIHVYESDFLVIYFLPYHSTL